MKVTNFKFIKIQLKFEKHHKAVFILAPVCVMSEEHNLFLHQE